MFADLVILNGTICTVDRLFSYCQAVAVRQGTIIDRGTTDQMKAYIGKDTKVIDAQESWCFLAPMIPTCTHAIPVLPCPLPSWT